MSREHGYALVIERAEGGGYGVYAPELPGCVATGRTRELALRRMRGAIELHIAGMREDGVMVPAPLAEVACATPVAAA